MGMENITFLFRQNAHYRWGRAEVKPSSMSGEISLHHTRWGRCRTGISSNRRPKYNNMPINIAACIVAVHVPASSYHASIRTKSGVMRRPSSTRWGHHLPQCVQFFDDAQVLKAESLHSAAAEGRNVTGAGEKYSLRHHYQRRESLWQLPGFRGYSQ